MNTFISDWLHEVALIAEGLNHLAIADMVNSLYRLRQQNGRLFILGIGGSSANASHAAADFRRIGGIEAYAPTDNMAEFSALANDCGWHSVFETWLAESQIGPSDAVLVLSVGGGSDTVSPNLVMALRFAKTQRATTLAIVGSQDGYAARNADVWIGVPCVNEKRRTPHSESFQAVLWHLLANLLGEMT
jgi:D-sedoheptulose 7-phosphate isomerase